MQTVALGWVIYEMTGSASWLGVVSFAANAPMLLGALVGGAVVDRAGRREVLAATQLVAAAAAFLLAVLAVHGSLRIGRVIAIAVVAGIAQSFYTPAAQAMIPSLVPSEQLLNAVSLNSVQFNLARIAGPVIAGFAYSRIGASGCFSLNGFTFLVLALVLARLDLPPRVPTRMGSLGEQVVAGFRYATAEPTIAAMLGFASALSLFAFPYIVLMPAVARDALGLGPEGLGVMMGSVGLGAVVGGLLLAAFGDVSRKALVAVICGAALAALLLVFSLSSTLWLALPVLFFLGMVQVGCVASLNTTIQLTVTEAMRGRVMGMLSFALFGLSTLGSVLLGALGDAIGIAGSLRVGAVVILGFVAHLLARSPAILQPVPEQIVSSR